MVWIFRISWDERKIEILEVVPEKMGSKPEGSRYGQKSQKHHLSSANLKIDSEYRMDVMTDVGYMKKIQWKWTS